MAQKLSLRLTNCSKSFFTFPNKFYIQVGGVAMGFTSGMILANILLTHHHKG